MNNSVEMSSANSFNARVAGLSPNKHFAFLNIDLDDMTFVNCLVGYEQGSQIIRLVSDALKHCFDDLKDVYHVHSDKFLIMLTFIDQRELKMICKRLNQSIRSVKLNSNKDLVITASIGVATSKHVGLNYDSLLRSSEIALHTAKRTGKNRAFFFDSTVEQQAVHSAKLLNELRGAIGRGEFFIHYQPIVSVHQSKVVGYEALLRWRHPNLGYVSPNEIIPIAETHDLMISIEKWLIEEIFKTYAKWFKQRNAPLIISINLSYKGLMNMDIAGFLQRLLKKYSLAATCFEFEITESVMIMNMDETLKTLNRLQEMGFNISLDDFGTGYSSLSYLRALPLKKVKLDRSFVKTVMEDDKDYEFLDSIIKMSKALGLEVVAEGVEMREQMNYLEQLGCDYLQGYYLGKPLALKDII